MNKPQIFFRLTKFDEIKGEVTGIATAELPDQSGEICDYETTKPHYMKWSERVSKATGGKSLGNVREMHGSVAAGKIIDLVFDDVAKAIIITAKVVDPVSLNKVKEGVLTGFSQGGDYVKRWKDGDLMRYTADPSEVSLVDNPCLAEATFEIIKSDGSTEMRKFHQKTAPKDLSQVWQAKDGSTHNTKAEATQHNTLLDARAAVAKELADLDALVADIGNDLDKRDAAAAEPADLKKLLLTKESWDAARAIEALQIIEGIMCGEEWEKMMGEAGEESQIAMLAEAMKSIKQFIAAEILEDEVDADVLAAAVKVELEKIRKAEGEASGEHVAAIHKAASSIMKRCMKCIGSDAEKILKADDSDTGDEPNDHIRHIHKKAAKIAHHAVELGAEAEGDEADDAGDDAAKMAKSALAAENAELRKSVVTVTAQLTEIAKRLKVVEDQPAARKGVTMIVKKGHELEQEPEADPAVEPHAFNMNGLSPAEVRSLTTPQRR